MRLRVFLMAVLLLTPVFSLAQDDDGQTYPGMERDRGDSPRTSDPTYVPREESPDEEDAREESYSRIDDPAVGLAAEFIIGAMFLESTRGALVDARLGIGARLTWEIGRLFSDDAIRQGLFLELIYLTTAFREGTELIFADTRFQYLIAAPAWAFPFGEGSAYAVYLQAGGGVAIGNSTLFADNGPNGIFSLQPVILYGLGFRGRPLLVGDGLLRLFFRVEVTRFRRGYADDTFLGGSIGLGF
ncbi:MAG: hypothetical protein ACKVPX_15845 [Myxococcaceae bacterium]